MSIRVSIDKKLIDNLKNEYTNQIFKEHGIYPTDSQLVTIALILFEAHKEDKEIEIKFIKTNKINYEHEIKYKIIEER